jgi:hypothetical protein
MQPAQWLKKEPSLIYAQAPINNCTWFCIHSDGETLQAFAKRWAYTSWSSSVMVPGAAGEEICSGVIIRADRHTGAVSDPFFVAPSENSSCAYVSSACSVDMPGVAALKHGNLLEINANGHTASAQLRFDCVGGMKARLLLLSGNDADGVDGIKLSNGGKSRLFLEGKPLKNSVVTLQKGINTLTLSDKLELPENVEMGSFSGNAVLVIQAE